METNRSTTDPDETQRYYPDDVRVYSTLASGVGVWRTETSRSTIGPDGTQAELIGTVFERIPHSSPVSRYGEWRQIKVLQVLMEHTDIIGMIFEYILHSSPVSEHGG